MNEQEANRVLAVDWGAKRIGLALSDPTRTIASPLMVVEHTSRAEDAARITDMAQEKGASLIIVGVTYDNENELSPAGRSAKRLADVIRDNSSLEVCLWSEEGSTRAAKHSRVEMGRPKSKRKGHFDEIAATVFLQSFLDEVK